ncbi:2OG-Fe(II) oxygenase [Pseudoalteromonas piscicida]|uniref:Proline hydroxylase n=1 Tax=Pseudoalteromonas piscicida TaxID=43662 RepID=A0AAD0RI29_PSEO7|nr:2OG-Fe(II) oxygenase family protein [Pseudoalteromonas piscicida]ASD66084.1 proline hydroxylase [Pseudoalteromonas piscicida]AXR03212.1 proline hydroxylase [Pseudoalteromonas piscicida]
MLQLSQQQQTELQQKLSNDGFARIENILDDTNAQQLHECLCNLDYQLALFHNGAAKSVKDSDILALTPQEQQALLEDIHSYASRGVGFMYGRHSIESTSPDALKKLYNDLNSSAVQSCFSAISGQNIIRTSAQATRFIGGQYLTRHNDIVEAEGRVYAYVLSLSKSWHPDWGGLLQFFERDGTPTKSYAPKFNSLVVFDVSKIHSVTYVAPFAKAPRLSVTGWFRTIDT